MKHGEKCCCGYNPAAKSSRVNNVTTQNSAYCCGMVELGNFNYVDPPGGKKMTHFHKVGGTWKTQANAEPTTKEDILARMGVPGSGFIATTGAGQEYLEPVLKEIGFTEAAEFRNPDHANTGVKLWVFVRHKMDGTTAEVAEPDVEYEEPDYDD